jgi:hypothetical protein
MSSTTMKTLLTAPPYFMTAFTAVFVAWNSDRLEELRRLLRRGNTELKEMAERGGKVFVPYMT